MPVRYFLVALFLFSSSATADTPVWDKWHLDNAFGRYGDWLVVADPSGRCYMLQSYGPKTDGNPPPELIIDHDDSVNLNAAGRYDAITYQVDTGDKFTVQNPGKKSPGYVVLPGVSVKMLNLASTLTVTINHGVSQTKQVYSLAGFAKAHDGMKRCILANDPPPAGD